MCVSPIVTKSLSFNPHPYNLYVNTVTVNKDFKLQTSKHQLTKKNRRAALSVNRLSKNSLYLSHLSNDPERGPDGYLRTWQDCKVFTRADRSVLYTRRLQTGSVLNIIQTLSLNSFNIHFIAIKLSKLNNQEGWVFSHISYKFNGKETEET